MNNKPCKYFLKLCNMFPYRYLFYFHSKTEHSKHCVSNFYNIFLCFADSASQYIYRFADRASQYIYRFADRASQYTWSVRKVSDLWPVKRNWLTWSVGHLITLKVVPLGLHTLLPAVPPLLEACRKSLFRNGV